MKYKFVRDQTEDGAADFSAAAADGKKLFISSFVLFIIIILYYARFKEKKGKNNLNPKP